jgi:LuxR family maltose regulon positive regulatory protein
MRIQRSSHEGAVVLALSGRLDRAAAPAVRRALLKELAAQPPAIICDLGQVEAIDPACAEVFTSIRHPALGWPDTPVVLCGAQLAVAGVLARYRLPERPALYPDLEQALRGARHRPPRLSECLALGPVPTAVGAGRAFVREVCDRWRLQELIGSAGLVASELITNAMVHAGTAMELRVELRGPRLHVAVKDQDPDLGRLAAARDGPARGLGLQIVDRLAAAWGVRQDGTAGKTVWCALDLPAAAPATAGEDDRPGDAAAPDTELIWTRLRPPTPRAGLLQRARLTSRLEAGLQGKLCLLDAPAGFGKTTLLAQWCAGAGRVAWVSLDEGDNEPARFWAYVIGALRTVEPGVGAAALLALRRPSVDLRRTLLPSLLNELSTLDSRLVLVLDDYHAVTNPACHESLAYFLDHLPPSVRVALSTRADPPLPLATMRARGELSEIRMAELEFTDEEASALLNGSLGLGLAGEDVERLAERTEGWPAGLVLAGLSLRGRRDASGFIASFHGDNRHVADYLAAEVLDGQPEEVRAFLLRTSILERLSGPLCDAVLDTEGSAGVLDELERSNLFLVPLDDHGEWYRYHHLFAQLLRLELGYREPELLPLLHRRAAGWHQRAGDVEEAIRHATAAGEPAEAGALIARHWLGYWRRGRLVAVARWLDGLPEEAILADPPVAYVAAWIGGFRGASRQETERRLAAATDDTWEGALPDGIPSLAFGVAMTRATLLYGDVGAAVAAGRQALELAGPDPSPSHWMAQAALGQALYLSGRPEEARPGLEGLAGAVSPSAQPFAAMTALAVLSLIAGDEGDDRAAMTLARRAAEVATAQGLDAEPLSGIAGLALGRALTRRGEPAEATEWLELAQELLGMDSMVVQRAHTLLLLASLRRGHGDPPGARALVGRARELVERCADPGVLPALLEQAEGGLEGAPPPRIDREAPLTERELAVLRLLPARLTNREIGRELYVSVNTIRSHIQAIYRKLEVASRDEAIASARQAGLLPGSPPAGRSRSHPG